MSTLDRRQFLGGAAAAAFAACRRNPRPNAVFILTDDQPDRMPENPEIQSALPEQSIR